MISHVVLGYPDWAIATQSVDAMVDAGDIIELQIPFSDPSADGQFLTKANHDALLNGVTLADGFSFAQKMNAKYPDTIFLFMTYLAVPYRYGLDTFMAKASEWVLRV